MTEEQPQQVLVSPVGLRPGVLYSALLTAGPQQLKRCLVICSAESAEPVARACQAAGYTGDVVLIQLADPFPSVEEINRQATEAVQHIDADVVFVNITGGTTLMGVLAERIASEARRGHRTVYRFALVDRRPQSEQEADPFRLGEAYWLDESPHEEQP